MNIKVKDLIPKRYKSKCQIIGYLKADIKLTSEISLKDKEKNVKKQLIDEKKNSEIFKSVMDRFPDAELIDVNSKKDGVDNE